MVSNRSLIEKIEALPPAKRAEVEMLVDRIYEPEELPETAPSDPLIERVRTRRERLLRGHGLYDTSAVLCELREDGE